MRAFLIFFILLSSVWLGVELQHDPGYVIISLNHWTIEATVWTSLITIICLFFVLHLVLLFLHWILNMPRRFRHWRLKQKAKHALKKQDLEQHQILKQKLLLDTTPEGYFTLGQLLEETHDSSGAILAYREGLKAAIHIK